LRACVLSQRPISKPQVSYFKTASVLFQIAD